MNIEDKYGIDINNETIKRAFTHASYGENSGVEGIESYQRLEFLGDKIIDYVIAEYLFRNRKVNEGRMSAILANYVCTKAHATYSEELNLKQYLRVGPKQYEDLIKNEKLLADLYEAFIGAVHEVYGMEKVREIMNDLVISRMTEEASEFLHDYKTAVVPYYRGVLRYEVVKEEVLEDKSLLYTANCIDRDDRVVGTGTGRTKRISTQMAAKNAIENAKKENN